MSVSIIFYTMAERQPKHNEHVIWLRPTGSFGFDGFDPQEVNAEYCWFQLDEDGTFSGNQMMYSSRNKIAPAGYKLEIMFDGEVVDDFTLWCPVKEYWKYFNKYDKAKAKYEIDKKKQWMKIILEQRRKENDA